MRNHCYFEKVVTVDGDVDQMIQFKVRLNWYYDPGVTNGMPEDCYPEEFEKIDEEIEDIIVADVEIDDPYLYEHVLDRYEEDWIMEQAWRQI